MNNDALQQRMTLARQVALEASRLTLRWFRGPIPGAAPSNNHPHPTTTPDLDLETKGDGSPVTIADRRAESLARNLINTAFPDDAILGEEFGEQPGTSGFRWVVDPIDGTVSFVHGVPLYGTILGLELNNSPVGGVIVMPVLNELVWGAKGLGAWHETNLDWSNCKGTTQPAKVSRRTDLSKATIVTTSLDYFEKVGQGALFPRLQRSCAVSRGWSDCYGLVLVATGRADAVVEPLVKPWDVCGIVPIVEEAGGRCTDFKGSRRIDTGNAIVSNGLLHNALLEVVSKT